MGLWHEKTFLLNLRDGVRCDFVAIGIEILHLTVVGPLVRDVERGSDRTAVRIRSALFEEIRVKALVKVVHGIVESEQNDLRHLLGRQIAYEKEWNAGEGKESRGVRGRYRYQQGEK